MTALRRVLILVLMASAIFAPANLVGESVWPMFRHDLKHTGRTGYTGPDSAALSWTFQTNDGIACSPSLGHDGTIYVGAGGYFGGGGDSALYAISSDGVFKWKYKTGRGDFGAGVFSSPAIGDDGTIYFGAFDHCVYALEDSVSYGKLKWKSMVATNQIYASPALTDYDVLYIGSLDSKFYALDMNDGTKLWPDTTGWCVFSSAAIIDDGTIYVGSKDHSMRAYEPGNSEPIWTLPVGYFYQGYLIDSSPAVGPDGTIYFGSDPYGAWGNEPVHVDTSFWAANPDGSLKWAFETGDGVESSPAIGWDGSIYFGSYDSCLYAVTDAGMQAELQWKFHTNGTVDASATIDGDGIIYFGSRDSTLYALYPDGSVKWTFKAGGGIESSVTIDGNGYLYFGCFDGKLYCLGTGAPDVGIVSLDMPEQLQPDETYLPAVTVGNYRASEQICQVSCVIDTSGTVIYADTVTVSNIPDGGRVPALFAPWLVGSELNVTYNISVSTILQADENNDNDMLQTQVESADVGYVCGDADGNGIVEISDCVYLINYVFVPGFPAPNPLVAGDTDCNGIVEISDEVLVLMYVFVPGSTPPCDTNNDGIPDC